MHVRLISFCRFVSDRNVLRQKSVPILCSGPLRPRALEASMCRWKPPPSLTAQAKADVALSQKMGIMSPYISELVECGVSTQDQNPRPLLWPAEVRVFESLLWQAVKPLPPTNLAQVALAAAAFPCLHSHVAAFALACLCCVLPFCR